MFIQEHDIRVFLNIKEESRVKKKGLTKSFLLIVTTFVIFAVHAALNSDPLPSWNNGPIKQNIIQFVETVSDQKSHDYVSPEDRIATIDQDGTLWVEQPLYTQFIFALDRIKKLAPQHPEWKGQEPFKSVLNNQYEGLTTQDFQSIFAITQSGMSVENYYDTAINWLENKKNPRYKRYYTELVYQPMLEIINYLHQNDFKVYIVTGGAQDFVRTYSKKIYNIPTERVIGTAGRTKYSYENDRPKLIKLPEILFINNKEGKAEGIYLFIGKKPIIAFGNSDGDREMLEWTQSGEGKRLMLLVHHDDAKREYAYDTQSKIGTFSAFLMEEAKKNNWNVISMKNDWKVIFPFNK